MNKFWTLLVLGVLVILMPFLGFPGSWKTTMLVGIGVAIVALATLLMRREHMYHYHDSPSSLKDQHH